MWNSLLTKVSLKSKKDLSKQFAVVVLDIDVGQALYGVPCWVKAIEILKPILSNYEMKISVDVNENSILKYVKSYFVNIISPESQEEYYLAMISQIYHDLKLIYSNKNVAIVINTFGWNASVGNLIHEEILKIIKPDHKIALKGLDFNEINQNEENITQEALDVLSKWHFILLK